MRCTCNKAQEERNLKILTLVAQGLNNRQIADQLGYAEKTIKLYLTVIFRELEAGSRCAAVAIAFRKKMLDPVKVYGLESAS